MHYFGRLYYLRSCMTFKEILQYHCRVKAILKQESQSTVMRNYSCIINIYTGCCVYLQPLLPQGVFNIQHINPTCLKFSWTKNIFSNKFLVLRTTFSTVVRNQIITCICQIYKRLIKRPLQNICVNVWLFDMKQWSRVQNIHDDIYILTYI